jgi:CheY-like chemotaxis protein
MWSAPAITVEWIGSHRIRDTALVTSTNVDRYCMPFRYRILFVDDEERLRVMAKAILELHGYEVLCAKDGFEGLAALRESLPDLIMSDLQMPNMDGFEFLSVVRQRFPHLPVIAISGEFSSVDVPNSVLADAFFEKSQYTRDQLIAIIAGLVSKFPVRPPIEKSHTSVWISHTESEYIAVTCTNCLRIFRILTPTGSGIYNATCEFCSSTVQLQLSRSAHKQNT